MKDQQNTNKEMNLEQQLQQEQELGRLQRQVRYLLPILQFAEDAATKRRLLRVFSRFQYTIMERDRKAFADHSSGQLAKQKRVIKILRNEQKNIETDLNVATAPAKLQHDQAVARELTELLKNYDEYNDQIKKEKWHLVEVQDQLRQVQKYRENLSSKQITDEQCQQRIMEGRRTTAALENKLDVQMKKFCTILAENRKLRDEIEHLLKERCE